MTISVTQAAMHISRTMFGLRWPYTGALRATAKQLRRLRHAGLRRPDWQRYIPHGNLRNPPMYSAKSFIFHSFEEKVWQMNANSRMENRLNLFCIPNSNFAWARLFRWFFSSDRNWFLKTQKWVKKIILPIPRHLKVWPLINQKISFTFLI